jgi:hypothetical protein
MKPGVEIAFECLPLRSVGRVDVPLDASPEFEAFCRRVKRALAKHGHHNSFYLHHGRYTLLLTNDPQVGLIEFSFEGVVLTDAEDGTTVDVDLDVQLRAETCDWLTEPVVEWFRNTVRQAVRVEFDRFIAAGDLERTKQRIARLQAESDSQGGFLGMGL